MEDENTITSTDGPSQPDPAPGSGPGQFPMEPKERQGSSLLRRTAPLLAAALIGGGIAGAVVVAVDDDEGGQTTIVREAAPDATTPAADDAATEPSSEPAVLTETPEGELSVQQIYKNAGPGVVRIQATTEGEGADAFGFGGGGSALGSGFVLDKSGHVVTNFHVVSGATQVEVVFSNSDEAAPATVLGTDPSTDLAILKVDLDANGLTPLPLGDSDTVEVGDRAIAIGNPFGLNRTVTLGIVSAVQREIQAPDGFDIDNVIQTDAAINRGNSGGPLLNGRGEVIGVNSQILTGGGDGNVGIGFAVPVNTVKEIAEQIISDGKVDRAYLGVTFLPITDDLRDTVKLPVEEGVIVASVVPDSPADEAGLRGGSEQVVVNGQSYVLGGDIVTAVDGTAVATPDDLVAAIRDKKPGDTVSLEINRDGSTETITVELGRRPVPNE